MAAATGPRRRDHRLAILAPIETFDLPEIGLDAGRLQLANGLHHQARPDLQIVGLPVALERVELGLFRRDQQLEHEAAAPGALQVVREPLQSRGLALVERPVALGVVAHQDLAEGRIEGLDMAGEVLAVLEVELVLPAFLRRTGSNDELGPGIAQDGGAELLVDQDARPVARRAAGQCREEAVVDDALGGRDLGRLGRAQRRLPAEQSGLERPAMVERLDIEGPVPAARHHDPFILR